MAVNRLVCLCSIGLVSLTLFASDVDSGKSKQDTKDSAPPVSRAREHVVTVLRHVDVPLSDRALKERLDAVHVLLRIRDASDCADVVCDVTFTGRLSTFGKAGDGLDRLDTPAKLKTVQSIAGDIKIVNSESVACDAHGRSWLGCTIAGTKNIILIKDAPAGAWAHEMGHAVGLPHRDEECGLTVMGAREGGKRAVNSAECDKFHSW